MKTFGFLIFILFLCGTSVYLVSNQWGGKGPNARPVVVEIQRGESPRQVSLKMSEAGVIVHPFYFEVYGKIFGKWPRVKAGEYSIPSRPSVERIFEILGSGKSLERLLLIREGQNLFEVAKSLDSLGFGTEKDWIDRFRSPIWISQALEVEDLHDFFASFYGGKIPSAEGFLFPDTYSFPKGIPPMDLFRKILRRFKKAWLRSVDLVGTDAAIVALPPEKLLALASIVEKETGAPEERPRIAGVFVNRLHKKMRLQSDPTTIYGIWERYTGNITRADLQTPHPWNTYTIPALPKTPISNPGEDALRAVSHPERHEYLFFVSHNDGTHEFSVTYENHSKAVKRFQLNPNAREGKSWRDLERRTKVGTGK